MEAKLIRVRLDVRYYLVYSAGGLDDLGLECKIWLIIGSVGDATEMPEVNLNDGLWEWR